MKKSLLFLFFFVWAFSAWAKRDTPKELKPTMQALAVELQALKPYMISAERFQSKSAQPLISKHLENLRDLAGSAAHQRVLEKKDYQATIKMLTSLLSETEKNFREGHKDLSRTLLHSTVHLCISCHTRVPMEETPKVKAAALPAAKDSIFEEAKFQFAMRQFPKAISLFEKEIRSYPKNKLSVPELLDALNYLATVYARIERDPKAGRKHFNKILKARNLPDFIEDDVAAWLSFFKEWEKESEFVLAKHTDAQVLAKAKQILGGNVSEPIYLRDRANHIAYLRVSGMLHEFLLQKPRSLLAPEAYYLLGICYLSLDHDFFVNFGTLYLKSCIQEFPKNPVARKCYLLLEEATILGYSGSSGTHVPPDVTQELLDLKRLLP